MEVNKPNQNREDTGYIKATHVNLTCLNKSRYDHDRYLIRYNPSVSGYTLAKPVADLRGGGGGGGRHRGQVMIFEHIFID